MLTLRVALLALLAGGALLVAGCGGDDDADADRAPVAEPQEEVEAPEEETDAPEADEPRGPRGAVITDDAADDNPQFGDVLFDRDRQAIYYFEPEGKGEPPQCYDSCAEAWPPVLTDGEPVARGAIRQRLLGTVERDDEDQLQVTYDGRPLYYYAHEDPGELRCHNIFHEGGLWLAVQPDGEPVPTT